MIVLSLFDGVGTGRLALERAGVRIERYYASEIDEKAMQIANTNFPDIVQIGDAEKVNIYDFEKIDLLIGGSPCQGFSRNGKHKNFDDPRSGLFLVFAEILEKARQINPNIKFMLENVKMKREWQDTITAFVEADPITIDSRIHTAQARERTYWTNIDRIEQPKTETVSVRDIAEKRNTQKYIKENGVWFDSGISEKERSIVYKAGGGDKDKTGNKSWLYHCRGWRRNKPCISYKQDKARKSDKRETTDAGLQLQCLLSA